MKTRKGFVSNSSSSSFIVFGRPAEKDEIDDPRYRVHQGYGSDGEYYFKPSDEIKGYIKSRGFGVIGIIEYLAINEEETFLTIGDLQKKLNAVDTPITISCIESDYHYPETVEEFKHRCLGDR